MKVSYLAIVELSKKIAQILPVVGGRGHFIACFRLSDSREDAKEKGTRFIFEFTL